MLKEQSNYTTTKTSPTPVYTDERELPVEYRRVSARSVNTLSSGRWLSAHVRRTWRKIKRWQNPTPLHHRTPHPPPPRTLHASPALAILILGRDTRLNYSTCLKKKTVADIKAIERPDRPSVTPHAPVLMKLLIRVRLSSVPVRSRILHLWWLPGFWWEREKPGAITATFVRHFGTGFWNEPNGARCRRLINTCRVLSMACSF